MREFDQVSIITGSNIRWLSTERGNIDGVWIVSAVVGDELLLCRDELLVSIPASGVRVVAAYSIDAMFDYIKRKSGYG